MLKVEDLTIDYHSVEDLEKICLELAPSLQFSFGLDKFGILMSLSGVETDFAKINRPKHEAAYAPGGAYFKNVQLSGLYKIAGAAASCSWGPWQLMAVKALELGFEGHPADLHSGRISGPFVVMLLNKIVQDGATTMDQLCDAYNTGSFRVGEPPKEYIAKFWNYYGRVIETKLNKGDGENG